MKVLFRFAIFLVVLFIALVGGAFLSGRTLPVDHTASVTGVVDAAPEVVFAKIADIAEGPSWRPQVKHVQVLDATPGHERWIEDLGHGQTMRFATIDSHSPERRTVKLDDPGAAYGGTWTYELAPGPSPNETSLTITENGFIHPPLYRFLMQHVIGMTYNLKVYLKNMQRSFAY